MIYSLVQVGSVFGVEVNKAALIQSRLWFAVMLQHKVLEAGSRIFLLHFGTMGGRGGALPSLLLSVVTKCWYLDIWNENGGMYKTMKAF